MAITWEEHRLLDGILNSNTEKPCLKTARIQVVKMKSWRHSAIPLKTTKEVVYRDADMRGLSYGTSQ